MTTSSRGVTAPAIPPEFVNAPFARDLYKSCLESCIPGGLYAEFGVFRGASLRAIRKLLSPEIPLYGFDSFKGLPEAWLGHKIGSFSTSVRPDLPNTYLVTGRFEDTLSRFAQEHPGYASFLHIDCDLHSSTKTVLSAFVDQIVPGTVILFDEIFGYAGYERHEYRAFREFIDETGKDFEAIARWDAYRAAVRIV